MRRYTGIFAVVAVAFAVGVGSGPQEAFSQSADEAGYAPDRILVKLEEDVPDRALEDLNRENDASTEAEIPVDEEEVSVIDLPEDLEVEEAVETYEDAPEVEYAEPDYRVYPSQSRTGPDDPAYPDLYGLNNTGQTGGTADADINAPEAWTRTTGNAGTVVAVIDTGVDIGHPDLADNIWVNEDEVAGNGIDDDSNGYVDDVNGWDFWSGDASVFDSSDGGHGTHVAGTIAAEGNNGIGVTGVSWKAKVMPLKFLGPRGGYVSDAAEALDYAVTNGAGISNNSWGGGGYSQTMKEALDAAEAAGHLFVAAAGNSAADNDADAHYPSGYGNANIISVAASDSNDRLASFSNYGVREVDLAAPGVSIKSTLPDNSYGNFSGTSMAAPHVAGAAALVQSFYPELTATETKSKLLASARRAPAFESRVATGGRLDAARALGIVPALPEAPEKLTALNLSAGSTALNYGSGTTLYGRLATSGKPLAGQKVRVERRTAGSGRYLLVREVTTDSRGRYVLRGLKPARNTYYRARFTGNTTSNLKPSASHVSFVGVRARVSLSTSKQVLKRGRARVISGQVTPYHAGSVRVEIRRNGELISTRQTKLRSGRYSLRYRTQRSGYYSFRAISPGHYDHLRGASPSGGFRVR